jgi:hypothetical protein|tara:strand:- start:95 stop:280 length:186 start_codon:yes stop_codon:yes gene_type:complete
MSYKIRYQEQDLHWQVWETPASSDDTESTSVIVMRFTSRDQAESFIEKRTATGSEKNNFEN